MKSYSDYSVSVATDWSAYGSKCSPEKAETIAANLAELIEEEFGGIHVSLTNEGGPVRGPDESLREEITSWIRDTGFSVALLA